MGRKRAAAVLGAMVAAAAACPTTSVAANGDITTLAGTGTGGFSGDGGPAVAAQLSQPSDAVMTADGSTFVTDRAGHRIRRISPTGTITTIAGTGTAGYNGDSIAAVGAQLHTPSGIDVASDGSLLIADQGNHRIRRISVGGTITTIAGTGSGGYNGDGIAATGAQLNSPVGLDVAADGSIVVSDSNNNRVRRISVGGTITTIAGTGSGGYNGDGIAATTAQLSFPVAAVDLGDGRVLIADASNDRMREVSAGGTISTMAGTGTPGFNGDNIAATTAQIDFPRHIVVAADGSIVFSDRDNNRVRRISGSTITTIAGTGTGGYNGDDQPATSAQLNSPRGLWAATDGSILVADTNNARFRKVEANLVPPPAPPPATPPPPPAPTPEEPPATPVSDVPALAPPPIAQPEKPGTPEPYSGPTQSADVAVPGAALNLTTPAGCVRPGQAFVVTLTFRKQRRKGNLFVKILHVDFRQGNERAVRDGKPTFRRTFRVSPRQRHGTTIAIQARATIKVRKGVSPKKSLRASVKTCA